MIPVLAGLCAMLLFMVGVTQLLWAVFCKDLPWNWRLLLIESTLYERWLRRRS